MKITSRRAASLALALVIIGAAPLTLSGCSLVSGAVQHAVDQAEQQAANGDDSSSGDSSDSSNSGDSGSDSSDVKEVPLPSDIPSDTPIVSGKVIDAYSAKGTDTEVWTVTVLVSGIDAFGDIESSLEGQGWTESFQTKASDQAAATFSKNNDGDNVTVAVDNQADGGAWEAIYIITKALS